MDLNYVYYWHHRYRKSLNRLLKVCCVPATSAILIAFFSSFLLWPLTVLMKQTRQPVHAVKQSIYLNVCDWHSNQWQVIIWGGEIFYCLSHLSDTYLSSKNVPITAKHKCSHLYQFSNFLKLRYMLLRCDKLQKFDLIIFFG